jgi:hypothetical protein
MKKCKYLICKYHYQTKNNVVIEMYSEKLNAVNNLFNIAVLYIKEKDGLNNIQGIDSLNTNRIINKSNFADTTHLPAGHYIVRDQQKDHLYKLEMWQKTVSYTKYYGVAKFKNHHWQHIFDLDIVELLLEKDKQKEVKVSEESQASAKKLATSFTNLDICKILKDSADNNTNISIKHLVRKYPDAFLKSS